MPDPIPSAVPAATIFRRLAVRVWHLLLLKEVPWLVGLMVTMLGWSLTHVVDRLTGAPLISYKLELSAKDGEPHSGSFVVRNLTRDIAFKNLRFQLYGSVADEAPEGLRRPIGATFIFQGEDFMATPEHRTAAGAKLPTWVLIYTVHELQPHQGWRLEFHNLHSKDGERPTLSVRTGAPPVIADA